MKIKKVSILGFKSFMDRQDIAFPVGISGVVGPNGCGKSNIVDAVRWCMGEQSPKELRGRRMEDVIFNGAGNYKPMGMAEVSLTFENGDGLFPPPLRRIASYRLPGACIGRGKANTGSTISLADSRIFKKSLWIPA